MQEFTSKNTSVNSDKVPAVFKKIAWIPGQINLDLGGGKFDSARVYLNQFSTQNCVYDPYNRTPEHNKQVLSKVDYDSVTISNVLNVIKEESNWKELIQLGLDHLKCGGKIYITVYEGDRSGLGRVSKKDCWQHNKKLSYYFSAIQQMNFLNGIQVNLKSGIVVLTKLN